ncbi:MAG: hypothetical protein HYY67_07260 [Thaumarchaeota archaeon]|nr:hypothetical protein [Nitrososphaerota archaeon]
MLRIEHSRLVRAPKRKIYEWWTDFQETDPSLSGKIIRNRRIVSRSSNEVIYEDEGNMLRQFQGMAKAFWRDCKMGDKEGYRKRMERLHQIS